MSGEQRGTRRVGRWAARLVRENGGATRASIKLAGLLNGVAASRFRGGGGKECAPRNMPASLSHEGEPKERVELAGLLTSGPGRESSAAFSLLTAPSQPRRGQWRVVGFRSRSQRRGRSGFAPDSLFFRGLQALEHQQPSVLLPGRAGVVNEKFGGGVAAGLVTLVRSGPWTECKFGAASDFFEDSRIGGAGRRYAGEVPRQAGRVAGCAPVAFT